MNNNPAGIDHLAQGGSPAGLHFPDYVLQQGSGSRTRTPTQNVPSSVFNNSPYALDDETAPFFPREAGRILFLQDFVYAG